MERCKLIIAGKAAEIDCYVDVLNPSMGEVIKSLPFTRLSTTRLIEIINEVQPPGIVNIVTGSTTSARC